MLYVCMFLLVYQNENLISSADIHFYSVTHYHKCIFLFLLSSNVVVYGIEMNLLKIDVGLDGFLMNSF